MPVMSAESDYINVVSLIVKYKVDKKLIPYLLNELKLHVDSSYAIHDKNYACFDSLIKYKHSDCLKVLLDHNLLNSRSIYLTEAWEHTPLTLSIKYGSYNCFTLLCDPKRSDVNQSLKKSCGSYYSTVYSPLYYASTLSPTSAAFIWMQKLLDNGAKIDCTPSPLIDACRKNNIELVKFLIKNNVKTDIKDLSTDDTPMLIAAKNNFKEILNLLLNGLPKPEEENPKKKTKITENDECPVCLEAKKDTALVPCGHVCCKTCAPSQKKCPLCRKVVSSTMKVFV